MNAQSSWFPVQSAQRLTYRNKTRKQNAKTPKILAQHPDIASSKKAWALPSDAFLSWLCHHLHPGLGGSCPKVTNSTPRDLAGKEAQGDLARQGPKLAIFNWRVPRGSQSPQGCQGPFAGLALALWLPWRAKESREGGSLCPWSGSVKTGQRQAHTHPSFHTFLAHDTSHRSRFCCFYRKILLIRSCSPSLGDTRKAGWLPSDSDTQRARLLKPSDRLQMPDFSLSSE